MALPPLRTLQNFFAPRSAATRVATPSPLAVTIDPKFPKLENMGRKNSGVLKWADMAFRELGPQATVKSLAKREIEAPEAKQFFTRFVASDLAATHPDKVTARTLQAELNKGVTALFLTSSKPPKTSAEFGRFVDSVVYQANTLTERASVEQKIQDVVNQFVGDSPKHARIKDALTWTLRRAATRGDFSDATVTEQLTKAAQRANRGEPFSTLQLAEAKLFEKSWEETQAMGQINTKARVSKLYTDGTKPSEDYNSNYNDYLAGKDLSLRKYFNDPDVLAALP